MTRNTPEEDAIMEATNGKCCIGCRHSRGRWTHNYAPDHFTKSKEWERYCRYDGEHFGETLKPDHICDKYKSPFDHTPNNYPIEALLGGVPYLFATRADYDEFYKKWRDSLK